MKQTGTWTHVDDLSVVWPALSRVQRTQPRENWAIRFTANVSLMSNNAAAVFAWRWLIFRTVALCEYAHYITVTFCYSIRHISVVISNRTTLFSVSY